MNAQFIVEAGGSLKRTVATVAPVSFWHIPGGTDYTNATVVLAFFDKLEDAQAFERQYSYPPELASLTVF